MHDVDGLLLFAPYFKVNTKWNLFMKTEDFAYYLSKIIPYIRKFSNGQIYSKEGEQRYRSYLFVSLKSVKELSKIGSDAQKAVMNIKIPTIWFHSKNDLAADFNTSHTLFNKLPSEDKEFIELTNSNHVLTYDNDWKFICKKIVKFIDQHR